MFRVGSLLFMFFCMAERWWISTLQSACQASCDGQTLQGSRIYLFGAGKTTSFFNYSILFYLVLIKLNLHYMLARNNLWTLNYSPSDLSVICSDIVSRILTSHCPPGLTVDQEPLILTCGCDHCNMALDTERSFFGENVFGVGFCSSIRKERKTTQILSRNFWIENRLTDGCDRLDLIPSLAEGAFVSSFKLKTGATMPILCCYSSHWTVSDSSLLIGLFFKGIF